MTPRNIYKPNTTTSRKKWVSSKFDRIVNFEQNWYEWRHQACICHTFFINEMYRRVGQFRPRITQPIIKKTLRFFLTIIESNFNHFLDNIRCIPLNKRDSILLENFSNLPSWTFLSFGSA